jgi:hypothetical protein
MSLLPVQVPGLVLAQAQVPVLVVQVPGLVLAQAV